MHEYFTCQQCRNEYHIRQLTKRNTQPGDYCPTCGDLEKCAACGEMFESKHVHYKHDIQNYVCTDCQTEYNEVIEYIKPLKNFELRISDFALNHPLKKAS